MPFHSRPPPSCPRLAHRLLPAAVACALLTACATYHAVPLPVAPEFPVGVPQASLATRGDAWPALHPRPFDAGDGLDIDEVATLAVVNNPELRIARQAVGVSAAQSFAAKLLPDPQLSFTHDFPVAAVASGSSAFVAGASYAINSLITHAAVSDAADADLRQARSNLLWQEWQVIAQARLLFVRIDAAQQRRVLFERTRALMTDRYQRTALALSKSLLAADAVAPHLAALQDLQRQIFDLERQTNQAQSDLHVLLGLAPDTEVHLQGAATLPAFQAGDVRGHAIARLNARPDITALRAGYAAQDAHYRAALLGQFPAINFGLQRARDTSNAYTRGFSLSLSLPILNRNRGEIAIQDATREKLRAEYQQRLNAGMGDIERIAAEQAISQRQLAAVDSALQQQETLTRKLRDGWRVGQVDALALAAAEVALLAKQGERIDVLQTIQEQRVGMLTLTGGYADATKEHT